MWKAIRQAWNRYLERLAKANQKSFGDAPLDCCKLNRKTPDASEAAKQQKTR